jgi:hypothetical protein
MPSGWHQMTWSVSLSLAARQGATRRGPNANEHDHREDRSRHGRGSTASSTSSGSCFTQTTWRRRMLPSFGGMERESCSWAKSRGKHQDTTPLAPRACVTQDRRACRNSWGDSQLAGCPSSDLCRRGNGLALLRGTPGQDDLPPVSCRARISQDAVHLDRAHPLG